MTRRVVFRADASTAIGTGHIMRCMTLAAQLTQHGLRCAFITRAHQGNLNEYIRASGCELHVLPSRNHHTVDASYHQWLGTTQENDADECAAMLTTWRPFWLVVDHYAIDARWEHQMMKHCEHLMVIDDLANRTHLSHILVDQTYGRTAAQYRSFVPRHCKLLCGSQYAILRPEFSKYRARSLRRRRSPRFGKLLISLGGVDSQNITGRVLENLRHSHLPIDLEISVILGKTNPWQCEVREMAQHMPRRTHVHVGVENMAELMFETDLAIGAAGSTSWERCALGVPTILLVLADNQREIAARLSTAGAARLFAVTDLERLPIIDADVSTTTELSRLSACASTITDGKGTSRVIKAMMMER